MTLMLSKPYPLGATLDDDGCNFAIYAPADAHLLLALFHADGSYQTLPLEQEYAGIRYTHVKGIKAGQRYGYLTHVNDELLYLADPYARALDHQLSYQVPFTPAESFDLPKCVVIDPQFDWQGVTKPRRPRDEMVLFETHVKGLTKLHPEVNKNQQGTYLGLISEPMLTFYREQNINTLQLLPIAACMHEPHLLEMGKVNYWGYNPYVFMAPDPRYAKHDAVTELKTAIRELHKQGIEVILDVVYNHTAEGGEGGPVFNLKALDPHYYLKHGQQYANFTGCGNTLDLAYQPTLNLIMDTLRYWVSEYQVDGFRFDLAATLGRHGENFSQESAFFKAVAQDPLLREVKLIAEPWDIGPNGYQVGNFPFGWNETNDKLRDITRSFWRGDQGYLKEFATRLMGSRDLYSASLWPYKLTVNYITYHDGFTLQDLVSYKHKHNEANGEQNRDGHGDNRSDNYGVEGDTDNMVIRTIRERQKRNFMASLLFAFGIPHILTADVVSHTQQGNNNAYCQDNEISWLNWSMTERKQYFKQWLSEMITARQRYMVPFIRAFSGETRNSNRVFWRRNDGSLMEQDDWNQVNSVALHIGIGEDGQELLYLINQTNATARFTLPGDKQQQWCVICDTNMRTVHQDTAQGEVLQLPVSMAILHYQPKKKATKE
ncbi:glycogen debranching protein GlgX [Vibrio sp. V27_P1S3P104]|uniref:glycogen debranching protein GlgX n=1 Tax=unclassified Vibrio TaxID=2614977 RepID=UPI0013726A69|nr:MULTISPECIES: glycogen debranching protein GlgX [unclassified Vibrio]NAW70137.1 glycogen debranching protein GlgX [Vibrio sp. V28_P6S34P95]NAX04598.1 glycogen debranching protein GlgX [Vibrio sp. V30_P3S12P165]NAX33764.1 glycogen debranching protein GlgX [Vibrio sp. V29_P1S30P107]NAX37590.1 glycogen debranching protein GlgX [Vibrio sp. V27_P1S3P104]NAX40645.1 glycogen debranching protein GlgX [Vibrio sp. V26_P1S5P106]